MAGPSVSFRQVLPYEGTLKSRFLFLLFAGMITYSENVQLLDDYQDEICTMVECVEWCECTGNTVTFSKFSGDFLFNNCVGISGFVVYDTCTSDPDTAVIAKQRGDNIKDCSWNRENPTIFFRNDTDASGTYSLRVWAGSNPEEYVPLREYCANKCNPACGITSAPTPTPPLSTTTPYSTHRKIDEMIPRYNTTPTPPIKPVILSQADARLLGISLGAFVAGLIICLIIVYICCRRRRNRGPKLPPRRLGNHTHIHGNPDYAAVQEMPMTTINSAPVGRGGAYPNGLYRSESLSATNAFNSDPSLHRSVSDFELLGEPPRPPIRQMSLLPGINPALADDTDGRTAPIDDYGYTKYLPDAENPAMPYMHLKVSPTLSEPAANSQIPPKPHRYRSNTADTHANAADVDRIIKRMREKEALREGVNRRFVPNQTGRGRSSTTGDDYNRLNRHRGVPRSRRHEAGAFTPVPVHAHYQSRPRRSPESIRKWRSLPDMTSGGNSAPSRQGTIKSDECPPVYHLLEPSPASSMGDYTKRKTYQLPYDAPDAASSRNSSQGSRGRNSRRAASESGPNTPCAPLAQGNADTLDRYDPVYEPRIANGGPVPNSPNTYQHLSFSHPPQDDDDFDDGAYQGAEELFDGDAYLKPKTTPRSSQVKPYLRSPQEKASPPSSHEKASRRSSQEKATPGLPQENGVQNGGNSGIRSPTARVPNGGSFHNNSMKSKSYIYESDNNNLSTKKTPSSLGRNAEYVPLKLKQTDDNFEVEDEMENGEYQYHPAGPGIDITV